MWHWLLIQLGSTQASTVAAMLDDADFFAVPAQGRFVTVPAQRRWFRV